MSAFIRYSELFYSVQGEGPNTGVPTLWIRLWGCNLTCRGFSQEHPEAPATYVPQIKPDFKTIKKLEDLPPLTTGCDSAYSWDPSYLKLAHKGTPTDIARDLVALLNKQALKSEVDVCFTGGEPMMQQKNIIDILNELRYSQEYLSMNVTIETNATQPILPVFAEFLRTEKQYNIQFSMSPKLLHTTGEIDAVKPAIITHYYQVAENSYLKFVMTHKDECWDELLEKLAAIDYAFENERLPSAYDICYIMPVGADLTQSSGKEVQMIADRTLKHGFKLAARLQNYIWNNAVGR